MRTRQQESGELRSQGTYPIHTSIELKHENIYIKYVKKWKK